MRRFVPSCLAMLAVIASLSAVALPARAGGWVPFDDGAAASPSAPQVLVLAVGRTGVTVAIDVPGVLSEDVAVEGRTLSRWALPGESATRLPGRPEIPTLSRLLATDGGGARVEVLDVDSVVLRDADLSPFVARPTRCGRPGGVATCDPRAYGVDGLAPADWAEIEAPGRLRGVEVARLVVHPVRYNPVRREAEVARRIVLRVAFPPAPAGADAWRREGVPSTFDAALRHSVLNWSVMRDAAPHAPERILVLAHDTLVDAMKPFADWKARRGFTVKVVPLSEVGTTGKAVQAYVQAAYDGPERPTYLVLVGDAAQMPYLKGNDGCASDWMYTQLDGSDLYSDVLVSRISAQTPAQVAVQVAKILAVESAPPEGADASWIPKATLVSSSEAADGPSDDDRCNDMAAVFQAHGYQQVDRLYHSTNNDKATGISAALDDGRGWITYLGHGSGTEWATTVPPYDISYVRDLQNTGKMPFVMDVSCANGQFDKGECFAEAWMNAGTTDDLRGASAMFSSSTDTAWDEPAVMGYGVVSAVLQGGQHRAGEALLAGRAYLVAQMGSGENVQQVFQQYVLFGDASMEIRTRVPAPLAVSHPGALPVGEVQVPVTVSDGVAPVADALVSLRKGDEFAGSAYTDVLGNASILVKTVTPGDLEVVATAADALPYTATIPVAVTGCGVMQVLPRAQQCDGPLAITVWDQDLDVDPAVAETATVGVRSGDGTPVALALTETGPHTGAFRGTLVLGAGGIPTTHGVDLTVTYDDVACEGAPRPVATVIGVDCRAPVVSGVAFADVSFDRVTVVATTDETARVRVGLSVKAGVESFVGESSGTQHAVTLKGLKPATAYHLILRARDIVGNAVVLADPSWVVTTAGCTPACEGRACGDDGCGGTCPPGCEAGQRCEDGICKGGAGCSPEYVPGGGAACEDCVCQVNSWCCSSWWDSGCIAKCNNQCGGCGTGCAPSCGTRLCGSNGCGGECGACPEGQVCTRNGACVPRCSPKCNGKDCGDDGCGGSCGACQDACTGVFDDALCVAGKCPAACCPSCTGKACGDDGCGGSCGACANACSGVPDDPALCVEGACASACCPSCGDRECGSHGCGGACGICGDGEVCGADGHCAAVPPDGTGDVPAAMDLPATDLGPDVPGEVAGDIPGDLVFDADLVPPGKKSSGGCDGTGRSSGGLAPILLLALVAGLGLRRRACAR